jgi:hypothetical protein
MDRNYKVPGKKLTKSFYAQETNRLQEITFLKRTGQSARHLSLAQPSDRRAKKAYVKHAAGGFNVDKRFGRFELTVLRIIVHTEVYQEQQSEQRAFAGDR